MQTKSDTKIKHIKIIKEKKININKQKVSIQPYNTKKVNSNLFANYLNNFRHIKNNNNNSTNKNDFSNLSKTKKFSNVFE